VVVAGTGGDSGKTLVSLGLCLAWRDEGIPVTAFKKGPDYIDAAWLEWAAGAPARNLDTFLMGRDAVRDAFVSHAAREGVSVIEGNRGLFDGASVEGTHSTAELAKLLDAPLILVLDVTKTTRTAGALALGCARFDPDLNLAGVVLNRVAGARHERVARAAVEGEAGLPVLGAIPRLRGGDPLPGRHLGLVTVQEHGRLDAVEKGLLEIIRSSVDLESIRAVASGSEALTYTTPRTTAPAESRVRIAVLRDSAFTFYYPENLEALEILGAELVFVSALEDDEIPPVDALYIGGGFPETHGKQLSTNRSLLRSLADMAAAGMPVYAECGGLMVLARSIVFEGETFPMAGVLPMDMVVDARPQGHGYAQVEVDRANPFFPVGTRIDGHEFHYSRVLDGTGLDSVFDVKRGTGSLPGRDGLVVGNVLASYIHLHARGTPAWAQGVVERARQWKSTRTRTEPRFDL
jgi:cobyrinic acid a,c-diamide synthase